MAETLTQETNKILRELLTKLINVTVTGTSGDATAANQTSQLAIATSILNQLQSVNDVEIKLVKDTVTGDYYIYSLKY